MEPGVFTRMGAEDCDTERVNLSTKKVTNKVKMRRKTLRHLRKKYNDHAEDNEGVTYEAGAF